MGDGYRAATCRVQASRDRPVVCSTGGWLDLRPRMLVTPPAALIQVMHRVPRTPESVELP
jgi:hypothetical protein